ncbi:hypothetical protein GN956_G70 [Arapaima gigas]
MDARDEPPLRIPLLCVGFQCGALLSHTLPALRRKEHDKNKAVLLEIVPRCLFRLAVLLWGLRPEERDGRTADCGLSVRRAPHGIT